MPLLIFLALLPSILLMAFFYFRDKYEKEPLKMLLKAFLLGIVVAVPAVIVEELLSIFISGLSVPGIANIELQNHISGFIRVFYSAFIVAALTEELLKYVFIRAFIWKSPELDESYDGIVYGVFLSLGFATIENVLYVADGGISVALMRIFTAVPAHALFGTVMGYYLGKAKFGSVSKAKCLFFGLFVPIVLHGIYDFLLMSGNILLIILLIPFMIYLWRRGLKNTRELIENSPFKRA